VTCLSPKKCLGHPEHALLLLQLELTAAHDLTDEMLVLLGTVETLRVLVSEASTTRQPSDAAAAAQDSAPESAVLVSGPELSATHDAVPEHAQPESDPADGVDSEPEAHAHEPELEPSEAEAETPSAESELGAHVTEAWPEADAFKAQPEKAQPEAHAARTEHGPATNPLGAVSQSKLQQLVAWASDRHRFSRPADSSAAPEQTVQSSEKLQDHMPSHMSNQPAAVKGKSEQTLDSEPAGIIATDSNQHSPIAHAEQHADSASGAMDFKPQPGVDSSVDQADSFEQIADVNAASDESSLPDKAQKVIRFLKTVIWTAVPAFALVLIWLLWPQHSSSSGGNGEDGIQYEAADDEEAPEVAAEVQEASPAAQESSGPVTRSRAAASSVRRSISRAASQARSGLKAALGSGSAEGQEADSAPWGSGVGVDGSAPEGSGSGADGSAPAGSGVGPDGGSPVRSGARTGGRARKSRLNRELAALGG
jgi:hypothetical protein